MLEIKRSIFVMTGIKTFKNLRVRLILSQKLVHLLQIYREQSLQDTIKRSRNMFYILKCF